MKKPCLLWLIAALTLLGACARRLMPPVEPLAFRASTYVPGPASPLAATPAPLPLRALTPTPPAVPTPADLYEQAYQELAKMLDDRYPLSFKRAVFVTENAYLDNQMSYTRFRNEIAYLARICRVIKQTNEQRLLYKEADKEAVGRNAAIFRLMQQTTPLQSGRDLAPYRYDFEDFNGDRDWRKMFVSKLLATHTGNCHSLPFLYKILADETGAPTWLALAPNHIYLKQHNRQTGWYNTELTSYQFPMDAWLMASGYISRETVVSGIYMDTLTAKQNIVLCLVDLAKGYERKVGRVAAEPFVTKCTDLALRHFPHYINAQLLQAETLRHKFERQTTKEAAQQVYAAMEAAYTRIFETGYREMPPRMYAQWLRSAREEKHKSTKKP